jgi:phosphatidylinositol alpha 1,6-mannosyltransferase
VTLEAMSSGLPCVVANATGSNALVKDGVTGFLKPPRDSDAFLRGVSALIHDPSLRKKMGGAARVSALSYEWSRVLGQIASYYEELQ